MKKILLFLFLITLLVSFTFIKTDEPGQIAQQYVGIWTEHWEGDVDYVDTLQFKLNSTGQLTISCVNNSNYKYSEIKPKKSSITFVMENTVDPNERFIIQYTLKRTSNNLIKGKIVNSRGKTVKVALKRWE